MSEIEQHRWTVLYHTALLELDLSRLPERIREAQVAIQERLQELHTQEGSMALEERRAMYDALHNLRVLSKTES